jgi:putative DNA primase/helicase
LERLKTPARGTETLAASLSYPKSKQDELKDVGGFVAGVLKDNRRKASNVLTRDVITLDLDNIPPGGTQDVLIRIESLGCAA